MKKSTVFCLALSIFMAGTQVQGQPGKGKGSKMAPYRKETVGTVEGRITSIDIVFNKAMQEEGLHLTVEKDSAKHIVHVCPKWYADKEKIAFDKDTTITVTGSVFEKDGQQNIYASEINHAGKTMTFRDKETGSHLWKGRYENPEKGKKGKYRKCKGPK